MDNIKIITDHKWKNFLYGYELTEKEKSDFDWMEKEDLETGSFFRYRKRIYSLSDFMNLHNTVHVQSDHPFKNLGYDGYLNDSSFSGVLIKVSECGDCYQVATFIS